MTAAAAAGAAALLRSEVAPRFRRSIERSERDREMTPEERKIVEDEQDEDKFIRYIKSPFIKQWTNESPNGKPGGRNDQREHLKEIMKVKAYRKGLELRQKRES